MGATCISQAFNGSSGLLGALQYSDGDGGFSSDENQAFWDSINNRLGIGTNNPQSKHHIFGDSNIVQQIIQSAAAQTSDIFQIRNSVSSSLLKIKSSGELDLINEVSGIIWSNKAGSIRYGGTANNELIFKSNGIDSFKITTNGSLRMLRSLELPFGTSYTVFGSGAASQHSGLQFNPISGANGTIKTVGTNSSGNPIDIAHFWVSGDFRVDEELNHDGNTIGFYGVTPVVQHSTSGELSDDGGLGGTTYTLGDLVRMCKDIGLIAL